MQTKNYPVLVQTWFSGLGSVILTGECENTDAMRWATREMLRWNEMRRPKPVEIISHSANYNDYRLEGIIRCGGVEDFGRPFTSITAILMDAEAVLPGELEMQKRLLAVRVTPETDKKELVMEMPTLPPRKEADLSVMQMHHTLPRKKSFWQFWK